MAYISLQHVGKRYQMGEITITAVDDISFEIEKGQFAVIVGPSGAGKTTLLNILGGMDNCDEGNVWLDGRNVSRFSARELTTYRRYDVGFVFQFYNLVQNLTALENVELASEICRDPLDPAETLRSVGLGERLNNFPAQLSGGEQQRVAIARALVNSPSVLLADEPSGNLDSHNRDEIHRLFFDLRERLGQTVVIVTHDENLAAMADRKITMSDGLILGCETAR